MRRALFLGAVTALAACSNEPSFGDGNGGSSSGDAGTGALSTSASSGASSGAGGDPTGSTTTSSPTATVSTPSSSSGNGGEGGGTISGGGGAGGEGEGGDGPCGTKDDCPPASGPCVFPVCDLGVCSEAAEPAGTDGGDCGVCQGGLHTGVCGMRLWTRAFPTAGDWSSIPISDQWSHANAPPPNGIDEAEHTRELGRLMVWAADGKFYERVVGDWQPPVTIASRFPGWPLDARVGAAVIWKPEAAVATETIFLTTRTAPLTAYAFDIDSEGQIVSAGTPEVIGPETDPDAPPQDTEPFDWAFAEQRAYIFESNDWVVLWEGIGGTVYEYWGGNDDFVSSEPDASSVFLIDGLGAPAEGTVQAAWHQVDTLYMLAP